MRKRRRRSDEEEDDQGNSGEDEQEVMWKIREWRGGGSGEKEGDPERRGSVEKKSTCTATIHKEGERCIKPNSQVQYDIDIPLHIFIIQSICILRTTVLFYSQLMQYHTILYGTGVIACVLFHRSWG